jgi:Rv2525c-like, glycoside hydrolase-like domain
MFFAIVWQKRALAAGAALAATTLSVAGAAAAAGQHSPGDRGGRGPHAGASATLRQVTYLGYTFKVPSNWPVINLAARPRTCVRFDRHAFYMGRPGTSQSCPSGLIGSAEAVLVAPAGTAPAGTAPAGTAPAGGRPSQATENPVAHRIVVSVPRITVTAAYRGDRAQVLAILASAGLPPPAVQDPAGIRLGSLDAGPTVAASATNSTGLGFDACAAPGSNVMRAWLAHSSYQAIGIYIGGSDRACAQPNLTAAWVSQQAAAGWHFIPLYVGPQVSFKGEVTSPASQAAGAAQDAVVQARTLGFGTGTPIYYDMEAYSPGRRRAALKFFSAWTAKLHSLGYKSAVYSSSDSGISDLASNYASPAMATPDVIYDALWNGNADTSDANVPAGDWANHQRVHQFSGNVTERHGGYPINIDQDYLDVQLGGGTGGGGGHGNGRPTRQASRAVSTTGRVVDSFFAGRDRALWSTAYQPGHGWSVPVSLGGTLQGEPSAVTTATGMMVFFRGAHGGRLHYVTASGGNWSAVRELAMGPLGTAPRAVSTASGAVYVFWLGVNPHQLWGARYTPARGWHGPALLASGLGSQPSPAVSGAGTVNVFWKGTDGRLWDMSRGAHRRWSAPAVVAMGQIGAAPHATAQHSGEIDVFWGGATPGSVWHGTYTPGSGWGSPQRAGDGMDGQLIVVGSTPSTESAFWKGPGGLLWRSTSQGTGWGPATAMPLGAIGTRLAAVGQSNGVVDVFWRGSDQHLWHSRYYPQTSLWTRPRDLGGSVR